MMDIEQVLTSQSYINTLARAIRAAQAHEFNSMQLVKQGIKNHSINLTANNTYRLHTLGNFFRIQEATGNLNIKTATNDLGDYPQGISWEVQGNKYYEYLDITSTTTQTIIITAGFGRVIDSNVDVNVTTIDTVSRVAWNGGIDLQSLGANLEFKQGSTTQARSSTGTSTSTLYTVPTSHKATVLETGLTHACDNGGGYGRIYDSNNRVYKEIVTDNTMDGFGSLHNPHQVYKSLELTAGQTLSMQLNQTSGGTTEGRGNYLIAEYDA